MNDKNTACERLEAELQLLQLQKLELVECLLQVAKDIESSQLEPGTQWSESEFIASSHDWTGETLARLWESLGRVEDKSETKISDNIEVTEAPLHLRLLRVGRASGIFGY